jgi:hypothetical protein
MSLVNATSVDFDQGFMFPLNRMEVLRRVLAVVEPDDDSVKPADFRHEPVRRRFARPP